jgi:chorismate mutase
MEDEYLEEKRAEIAQTDKEIIALLRKRLDIATDIGRYKAEHGIEVYNPQVAQKVIDRYRYLGAENGMDPDRCEEICRAIMAESCANEEVAKEPEKEDVPDDEDDKFSEKAAKASQNFRNIGIGLTVILFIASIAVAAVCADDAGGAAVMVGLTIVPVALVFIAFWLGYNDAKECANEDDLKSLSRRTWLFGGIFALIAVVFIALFATA